MPRYGTFQYGYGWRYGFGEEQTPSYEQGYIPRAKADTLFYGTFSGSRTDDAQTGDLGDDLSQHGVDWLEDATDQRIDASSGGNPIPHTQVYSNKCIEMYCEIDTDATGALIMLRTTRDSGTDGGNPRITIDQTNQLLQYEEGSLYTDFDIDISSMWTGGWKRFLIVLSTETSPGDIVRNELAIIDAATGECLKSTFHTDDYDSKFVTLNSYYRFGNLSIGEYRFFAIRLSRRYHPIEESYWDFIGPDRNVPATFSHKTRMEIWLPDRNTIDLSNEGQLAGPTFAWAAAATLQNDALTLGPLVNWVNPWPDAIGWPTATMEDNRMLIADENVTYRHIVTSICARPIPPVCNAVKIRAYLDARYDVSLGTPGSFNVRVYSQGYKPGFVDNDPWGNPSASFATQSVTASEDHEDGEIDGSWVDFGVLPVRVNKRGFSWFSMSRQQGGTNYRYLYIKAFCVEPIISSTASPFAVDF